VVLRKEVSELLVGGLLEHCLLPQIWGQVGVSSSDGSVGSLSKISKSSSGSLGRGVTILNAGHLEQLLGDGGGDDTSTTGCGDQSHPDRATLTSHLARDGVGLSHVGTPEPTPDGNDAQLGRNDGSTDGSSHLLGALNTQTNMTIVISDSCKKIF